MATKKAPDKKKTSALKDLKSSVKKNSEDKKKEGTPIQRLKKRIAEGKENREKGSSVYKKSAKKK